MNNQNHIKKLKSFFDKNIESAFPINLIHPIKNFIFDFDGVLVKECDIIEKGYAWLIRAVREKNYNTNDLNILKADFDEARIIRPQVKAKSQAEKIAIVNEKYGCLDLTEELIQYLILWWTSNVFSNLIKTQFGEKPDDYLLEGAKGFVEKASQVGNVFGLTANIQPQAEFLMDFVGLTKNFIEIVGYPADIKENVNLSKQKMLINLMNKHDLHANQTCYIGDSVPDIKAGQGAGIFTVGIANDFQNGVALIEKGCDIIATSTAAFVEILSLSE